MPYIPTEKTLVAANLDKIRRIRSLAFNGKSPNGQASLMEKIINFDTIVQRGVENTSDGKSFDSFII